MAESDHQSQRQQDSTLLLMSLNRSTSLLAEKAFLSSLLLWDIYNNTKQMLITMFERRNCAQAAFLPGSENKWSVGGLWAGQATRRWGKSQLWWRCWQDLYAMSIQGCLSLRFSLAWPVWILNRHPLLWTHWAHLSAWVHIGLDEH